VLAAKPLVKPSGKPLGKLFGKPNRKETGAGIPMKLYTGSHDSSVAVLGRSVTLGKLLSFQEQSDTSPSPAGSVGATPQGDFDHSECKPAFPHH